MALDILQDPNDPNNKASTGQTGGNASAIDPNAAVGQGGGVAGGQGATAAAPAATTPGSSGSGTTNTSGNAGPTTSKTGTGFVNIQNILNANKGAGAQLGSQVGSGIQQQATDVGQQLGQAQQTFGAASQAGTLGSTADQSGLAGILSGVQGYSAPGVNTTGSGTTTPPANTGTTQYQQAGAAPTSGPNGYPTTQNSIANPWTPAQISAYNAANQGVPASQNLSTPLDAGLTSGQVSQFQNYLGGAYTGPQQLASSNTLAQLGNQAQQVNALGQNVGTSGGRQQLLQQFVGGNNANYGTGAQGLDELLLGQGGAQPLQQAAQTAAQLPQQLQQAETGAENQAGYGAAQSAQFGKNALASLTGTQAGILAPAQALSATAGTADTATLNNYNAIKAALTAPTTATTPGAAQTTMSPTDYQNAIQLMQTQGLITPAEATSLSGLNSSNIIGGPAELATLLGNTLTNTAAQGNTASSFLSPSDQAKLNAISQLQGQNQNSLTQNVPIYQAGSNAFDLNSFMNQVGENTPVPAGAAAPAAGTTWTPDNLATNPYLNTALWNLPSNINNAGNNATTPGGLAAIATGNPYAVAIPTISQGLQNIIPSGFHFSDGGLVPTKEELKYKRLSEMFKKK